MAGGRRTPTRANSRLREAEAALAAGSAAPEAARGQA